MFKMLMYLNGVIYDYSKLLANTLPQPEFMALPPIKPLKRRTYDMLVNDLTKYEINVKHHHVKQPLVYATTFMLPGTETGLKELKE